MTLICFPSISIPYDQGYFWLSFIAFIFLIIAIVALIGLLIKNKNNDGCYTKLKPFIMISLFIAIIFLLAAIFSYIAYTNRMKILEMDILCQQRKIFIEGQLNAGVPHTHVIASAFTMSPTILSQEIGQPLPSVIALTA